MKYKDVQSISRSDAVKVLAGTDPMAISSALVSLALHDPDWRWVQGLCIERLRDRNEDIAGAAATCLGHLARIHRCLDVSVVIPALESARDYEPIRGRVEDALEDVQTYLGADGRGNRGKE